MKRYPRKIIVSIDEETWNYLEHRRLSKSQWIRSAIKTKRMLIESSIAWQKKHKCPYSKRYDAFRDYVRKHMYVLEKGDYLPDFDEIYKRVRSMDPNAEIQPQPL